MIILALILILISVVCFFAAQRLEIKPVEPCEMDTVRTALDYALAKEDYHEAHYAALHMSQLCKQRMMEQRQD